MSAVDSPTVGELYWVHLRYPSDVKIKSPEKGQPRPVPLREPDGCHPIDSPVSSGNVTTATRHMGVLIHYNSSTKIGALFIGTGAIPDQPQRFVPWKGTCRELHQPSNPLVLDPEDAFVRHPGFFNFSHLIRARVVQQGEPGVQAASPGPVYVREMFAGRILHSFLPPVSMSYLKDLHGDYWSGVRYSESGEMIPAGHWGAGGGAGGGVPPLGGGHHDAQGGHCAPQSRKTITRAQRVSDPVYPGSQLSHSVLMEIAELHASAADEQARLAAGELDDGLGCYTVEFFPLSVEVIPHCDPFPFEIVGVCPDEIL